MNVARPETERRRPLDLEALAQLPSDVVSVVGADGRARWVSPSVQRTLGYGADEYTSTAGLDMFHPDDRAEVARRWERMLRAPGNEVRLEVRLRAADGSWRWIDAVATNHLDDPAVAGVVVNFRDVSERRVAEDALRSSEERFRALVQASTEVVAVTDADGTITYCSPSSRRVFGRGPDELLGVRPLDVVHPDDVAAGLRALGPAFSASGAVGVAELRVRHADGGWRWTETTVRNLLDDPFVHGVVCNVRDIDDRKRAEDARRASEERLLSVLQHSRDVVGVLDLDGRLSWIAPSVEDMLGHDVRELVGRPVAELVHPDDLELALDRLERTVSGELAPDPITIRLRTASGDFLPVEVAGALLEGGAEELKGVIVSMRDVTWRVDAEERLRRSEERFRALVQESSDVVLLTDADGTMTWVSPAVRHVLGHDPDDLVGTNGAELAHPDDLGAVSELLGPVYERPGAREAIEARYRDAAGTFRWMELTVTNLLEDERVEGVVIHARDITERREAERQRRSEEERFRTMAQASPIGIFQQDRGEGCVYVNERWQEITGLTFEEARGEGWKRALHPEDAALLQIDEGGDPLVPEGEAQFRVVRPDGEQRWVAARVGALRDDQGEVRSFVGTLEDVTERLEAQRDSERLTDIFEATEDVVGIIDRQGTLLYANHAARRFFRLGDVALDEVRLGSLVPDELVELSLHDVLPRLEVDGMWSGELAVPRADGEVVPMLAQVLAHADESGPPQHFSVVMHDISERKRFESELAHQATHDPLTGLPNRSLLLERLDRALARAERHGSRVAVLFLDLDHFKVVNDSLGHELGDELLRSIAARLTQALRPGDVVARFGGDEFVVLCEDLVGASDAVAIARRVTDALSDSFAVGENEVFVGVSIGIAFPGDTDVEAATLIRDADAAMYRAKAKGRARWEVFDNAMRASAIDRLDIENALRRAVERRELRVHFQPLISLATGEARGVEALLRWEHPERGLLAPDDFITVAEETGLIVPIGVWVLRAACQQLQRWTASGAASPRFSLSVNLSGRQLSSPSLVDDVAAVLDETGIDPSRLELEITESVLMDDVDASQATLTALRGLGVRLGIDDFGTGYSSMSYLRRFPVDVLKVDRSFVDGLGADPSDSAIVAAIVTLAHTLGLKAVAEGVETAEHLVELRRLGCDFAQGFHFARPMVGDDLSAFLEEGTTW